MQERKHFYSSIGWLLLLNAIIKPLWIFGIDRQVQNIAGTSAYGTYFSLLNFSIVFSFLLDWGLTTYFNRQLAAKNDFLVQAGNFLILKIFFALLYTAIVLFAAFAAGIHQWHLLVLVLVVQVLTSLFIFLRNVFSALQWFRTDAWLSVLDKGLMILVCGTYILLPAFFGRLDIHLFLFIQLFCTALAIIIAFLILFWNKISFSFAKQKVFNGPLLKSLLPFALIVLLMSAHYRLDGFLLERLHHDGAAQAGIYAMAYRLLDAANMIGFLVASFLMPFITRHYSAGTSVTEVVLNSRHLLMIFSVSVAMAAVFLAPWIQQLLYHTTDQSASIVLQYCIPALIGYSLVQVYGTVLTATGHIVTFGKIVLASLLLNLLINIWLIPGQGAMACCYAALASQLFCGVATLLVVKQKTGIPIDNKSVLIYLFIASLLALGYWVGKVAGVPAAALLAGSIILIFILSFLTGLFSWKQWKNYLLPKQ